MKRRNPARPGHVNKKRNPATTPQEDWEAGYAAGLADYRRAPQQPSYDGAKAAYAKVWARYGRTWMDGYTRGFERDYEPPQRRSPSYGDDFEDCEEREDRYRNPTPLKSLAEIARERTADRAAAKGFQSGDTVKVTFPYHQRASMAHLHGQIGTVDRKVRGGGRTSVVVRLADGREAWLGPEHLALFVRPNPRARYFPALNAAGERFHAWQTKGLRKAVRLVTRRNPLGDAGSMQVVAPSITTAVLKAQLRAGDVVEVYAVGGYAGFWRWDGKALIATSGNASREAGQTWASFVQEHRYLKAIDRVVLNRAELHRGGPVRNPARRNPSMRTPVENMKTHVAAIRRAIRKEVARIAVEGEHGASKWGAIQMMIGRVSWTGEPGENLPLVDALEAEVRAAREEATAARRAYRVVQDERDAEERRLSRVAANTPEARYAAEIRRIYGR